MYVRFNPTLFSSLLRNTEEYPQGSIVYAECWFDSNDGGDADNNRIPDKDGRVADHYKRSDGLVFKMERQRAVEDPD